MTALPLPPVPEPYHLPFHYGALHNVGVDYLVAPGPVRELLAKRHPGLEAADFDGRACVSLNYQLYFAQYPGGGGITQEVELNVIAHPAFAEDRLPAINYGQYARGYDQTKLLGIARMHVLCDNPLAIDAGTRLYAEPKHPGWFEVELPSPNAASVREHWSFTCRRATLGPDGLRRHDDPVLTVEADLAGLTPEPVDSTPITGYGTDDEGRLLAGPLKVHAPYRFYALDDRTADRVGLTVGAPASGPASGAARDLARLVGDAPAAGVWTYQSAPVAAHHRPYYVR
ncbi:hypothetical protein RMN57_03465 [Kitasatospora sp. CM 4170]|uniref:Acetoacetate decarboxylase n=1 Tax=Kitasatospora aburaviensis TaxID=67265 RepID=A0ABW1EXM8_9ACTN|nr:hypothetical protein [Kitasatospora sp. CM 4170]WNM43828.1 hypothetical protein RMN57_03465 [Kitasatospora sp. CM 4170]